ncbi:ABC transporter permease [Tessaracoccus aquimaris]|uniref:ABC transporter permease n=1 Tax=Tessaracoccus aquimaris TaxID=1332264 RepID=A0A1Q2CLV8_9ACTN|nr:sugar ABC transporter permease [Tessaracoccus aquimaris]AQP47055.1 ABC transporter permease [Tessaracoccus aquimaris]
MKIADKFIEMIMAIIIFAAVVALIVGVAWLVGRLKSKTSDRLQGLVYILPVLVMLLAGLVWPAVLTIRQAFGGPTGDKGFTLHNFATVFKSPELLGPLLNTIVWVLAVPVLATVIGLAYAILVDRSRFEAFAKALIFLPMAISMVGASIIWKFVYDVRGPGQTQVGLFNAILTFFGADPVDFMQARGWNTFWLIIVMVWIQAGFAMTVLSAAIKAIPDDLIEAAKIDGTTGWRLFRFITLPSIRGSLVVVLTTVGIATLKVFDVVRTMTGGQFDTSVLALEFYNYSFRYFEYGTGAALAVILFILVLPIVIYNVVQMRKDA